jgi:predicted metal-dependent HD superfamily phosphohydrolase
VTSTAPPALREAWSTTTAALGADELAAAGVFDDLDTRYSEPARAYHTWSHIAHVVEVSRWILARVVAPEPPVLLGAFFHDAVYRPDRHGGGDDDDDESASARLGHTACDLMALPDEVGHEVAALVLATRDHRPDDPAQAVLCDADLAILASDPSTYDVYRRAIRVEYGHLDDRAFAHGRTQVLRSLLDRDRLYTTPVMRDRGEAVARANLERELALLA